MNLESLRRKRARRMGIKGVSHSGQKRISFILERGTRKFHGDVGLWMQYLEYSQQQKAYKKVGQIFTSLLRLHPTKPELWIIAAKYVMDDQGDMTSARSYMQRGLRFCKHSKELWLEYFKLELIYMAKIATRRKILGIGSDRQDHIIDEVLDDVSADRIMLPPITVEDINPSLQSDDPTNQRLLDTLGESPALTGAIPIAIFDAAMDIFHDIDFGGRCFDLTASFETISSSVKILQHISDTLNAINLNSPTAISCKIRLPLIGVHYGSPKFPVILGSVVKHLKKSIDSQPSLDLIEKATDWLLPYFAHTDLDQDIRRVLLATLAYNVGQYRNVALIEPIASADKIASYVETLRAGGLDDSASPLLSWSLDKWTSNDRLLALKRTTAQDTGRSQ